MPGKEVNHKINMNEIEGKVGYTSINSFYKNK